MLIFFYFFFVVLFAQNDCSGDRYTDYIFDVGTDYGVLYGQNTNQTISGSEYTQNLYMDVYYPIDDDLSDRPLIFFLFGGSFVEGSKGLLISTRTSTVLPSTLTLSNDNTFVIVQPKR